MSAACHVLRIAASFAMLFAGVACADSAGNSGMYSTTVSDAQAQLETTLILPDASVGSPLRIRIRYALHNKSGQALASLDRGNTDKPGVIRPRFRLEKAGAVVALDALPIPEPGPTHPDVPLARVIDSDGTGNGEFDLTVPATLPGSDANGNPNRTPVTRLRFCLGYAPFSADRFVRRDEYWIPSVRTIEQEQQRLCTPWFDLVARRYEDA